MFCADTPIPSFFIFTYAVPQLLYYSHIPAIFVSLLLGIFVFYKNKNNLSSKILFFLAISFSLWAVSNLVVWTNPDSRIVLFFWSLILFWEFCIFLCSFYLNYVFIKNEDLSFFVKIIIFIASLPILLLLSTSFNLFDFDVSINCGPSEGFLWNYLYVIEFIVVAAIIIFSIINFRKKDKQKRTQIAFFSSSLLLFLTSFFITGYISSLLYDLNLTNLFDLEQYGLFGMTFFIGVLVYMIVKFEAFNVKLMGAQALVVGLVALIFSEFFFVGIENVTSTVLISVTVLLTTILGLVLINSVKNEVKRKDDLQAMSDQLAAANDELRKLDNAKSEFISIASHQLRTPLTAIKGFISLILEGTYGEVSPVVHDALNKVYLSNERIIGLVENLLTVSRIESGRIEYRFEPTRIENIINELNDIFIMVAKQKSMYLNILLPKDPLPEVEMDGQKIRELISNLVDNALKYSNEGGVTVKAEMANSNYVRVTVSDTGIGIPADEIPYLFVKFSRGKDINRLHAGGTGLGLYVAKNIVEAHHGKIWVESDGAGKGSRFIMELPIKHAA
jgi:signal transduction histidine kinase